VRLAAAVATLVILAAGASIFSGATGDGSLGGTAAGGGLDIGPIMVFLAGAVAGGAATALWAKAR